MVDCRDIHSRLRAGEDLDAAEARAHLRGCGACAALVSDKRALGRVLAASPPHEEQEYLASLFEAVQADQAEDKGFRARLRAWPTYARVTVVLLVLAVVMAAVAIFSRRVDFEIFPLLQMGATVSAYILLAWLGSTAALRSLARSEYAWTRWILGFALLLPLALALLPPAHQNHPASLEGIDETFLARAAACFTYGLVTSLPILFVLWLVDRTDHRLARQAPLAAVVSGLAANLSLQLHCPIVHTEHLLAGHAAVAGFLFVVYGLTWPRLRALRR